MRPYGCVKRRSQLPFAAVFSRARTYPNTGGDALVMRKSRVRFPEAAPGQATCGREGPRSVPATMPARGKCGGELRGREGQCRNPAGTHTSHEGTGNCWLHESGGQAVRPRGRCLACGKDSALRSDGMIWPHTIPGGMFRFVPHSPNGYSCPGSGGRPMTADEAPAFDEAHRQWQAAEMAAWREQWERRDQEELQRRLDAGGFRRFDGESLAACPWQSRRLAFIAVGPAGPATFACDVSVKRAMLKSEYTVLVAWPGEWCQHVFLLSDQDKAAVLTALGSQ